MSDEILTILVESKSNPGTFHEVTLDVETGMTTCTCPAGQYNRPCRHALGVRNHKWLAPQLQRSVEELKGKANKPT